MGNDPMTALGLRLVIKCADPECGMAGCAGARVAKALEEVRRKEREACARLVRAYGRHNEGWCDTREVAAAIRARGRKGGSK